MKSIFTVIFTLILPITICAIDFKIIEICNRIEGCPVSTDSSTSNGYCPTCVKETIILPNSIPPKKGSIKHKQVYEVSSATEFSYTMWLQEYSLKYHF